MIVTCSSCPAKYRYDESRFQGKRAKKIRCTKCKTVFEVVNPAMGSVAQDETQGRRPAETTKQMRLEVPGAEAPPTEESEARVSFQSHRYSLAIIAGPDSGQIHKIPKPSVVIGRKDSDINVEDTEVSRSHCSLVVREDGVILTDLGSTNGTWVGNEKITGEVVLVNQDEFAVGASTLMLIVTDHGE